MASENNAQNENNAADVRRLLIAVDKLAEAMAGLIEVVRDDGKLLRELSEKIAKLEEDLAEPVVETRAELVPLRDQAYELRAFANRYRHIMDSGSFCTTQSIREDLARVLDASGRWSCLRHRCPRCTQALQSLIEAQNLAGTVEMATIHSSDVRFRHIADLFDKAWQDAAKCPKE